MRKNRRAEDWMQTSWRPAAAITYMVICVLDFGIFPITWSVMQVVFNHPLSQWMPVTLQGAGLFHISYGAILGISAFGRTQEKIYDAKEQAIINKQTKEKNET